MKCVFARDVHVVQLRQSSSERKVNTWPIGDSVEFASPQGCLTGVATAVILLIYPREEEKKCKL